jgi:hypothetical protein
MMIALRLPEGSNPTSAERAQLEAEELSRPYQLEMVRDGRQVVLVCGDTAADALRHWFSARPGPNGPNDCIRWVRRPEVKP